MRYINSHWSSPIVLLLFIAANSFSQSATDVRELELAKPIERELSGGETHLYSVQINAGQLLTLIVDQRGIDVVVALLKSDGKQLMEVDSPNGTKGPERVSFVAEDSGTYRLQLRSPNKQASSGRYEVKVEALRAATANELAEFRARQFAIALTLSKTDPERAAMLSRDKELVTVELMRALYEQARALRNQRTVAQSITISQLGLKLAEQLGDKRGIADFLYNIGNALARQGNNDQALRYLERSLPLQEELGDKLKLADTLNVLGSVYIDRNEPYAGVDFYKKALGLYQEIKLHDGIMGTLNNIANLYHNQGNFIEALAYYNQALSISEEERNPGAFVLVLNNIGRVLRTQGNLPDALTHFQKVLSLREASGDKIGTANVLLDIGFVYQLQAEYGPALEYRRKALAIGEMLGNKPVIAQSLFNLGNLHRIQGKNAQALEFFERELKVREAIGDRAPIITAMLNVGFSHRRLGRADRALEYTDKALALSEAAGRKELQAFTLLNLAINYRTQGDYSHALEYFNKELKLRDALGDRRASAIALNNLGMVSRFQGNYPEALEFSRKALELGEQQGSKSIIADAYSSIGDIHRIQGDYARALEQYRESLKLYEELRDKRGIANALHRIGIVQEHQGAHDLALDYFQRDLKLREELGDKGLIADTLNTIGIVHYSWKNYPLAMEFFKKSLELQQQIGIKRGVAIAQGNIANVLRDQKNYASAIELFEKNLKLVESIDDKELIASALGDMSEGYYLQGNIPTSLEFANRASSASKEINLPEVFWNARLTAGKAYRDLKRTTEARQAFEEAIHEIESVRSRIAGAGARASYFATVQQSYELYIDLLMQQNKQHPGDGNDALALQLNERARARSLLEALNEARADIRQGIDPQLLDREHSLQYRLNAAAERQTRLLASPHTVEQSTDLQKEINALTADYEDVEAQIRQSSPRYASLTQPQPLTLSNIQKDLLDRDTALLEYSLGEQRSYLWVVTQTSLQSFELPKRAELENNIRQVVALLSEGNRWVSGLRSKMEYALVSERLSRTLLPPTLLSRLKVKRLVVVADGALQYLPFSSQPRTAGTSLRRRATATNGQPLIASYEISSLPSASTLSVLRRDTANRAPQSKTVVVIADPVFESTDERVKVATAQNTKKTVVERGTAKRDHSENPSAIILERALRLDTDGKSNGSSSIPLRISRLPFTRFEAEGILDSAGRGQSLRATDFLASRETATSAELTQYRFIHFATHGLLNSAHPELSGIVLSLVNEQGQPVDGFLRLHDIYNLNLPADLVVLSACQTGLGKEIRGEGLVGLTRGFMYAGAPRVVASLWKVDDAATAELMKRFYAGMLRDNLRPAAALRRAKIEMWKQKRWEAPFYWAAFELQGEWK